MSAKTYDQLFHDAALCLKAGRSVVVDAVFLKPEERARAEALAKAADVAFQGVWLEAPPEVQAPASPPGSTTPRTPTSRCWSPTFGPRSG